MKKKNYDSIINNNFKNAIEDYNFLIEKGYTVKSLIKLVGDRYRLNKEQRDTISRSISNIKDSKKRKSKKTLKLSSEDSLYVDFYNVFFTIFNYLNGKLLFICTDSFLRDCGGIFGKISLKSDQYKKEVDIILNYLKDLKLKHIEFILDSPISFSGEFATYINKRAIELECSATAYTNRSPDYELKNIEHGIISTSDSIIIENSKVNVFDLAFNILKKKYEPKFLNINSIIKTVKV